MENRYQTAFDEPLLTTADTLEDECQNFSVAVLQAAKKIFGPPANLTAVPTMVQRAQADIEQFVMQHPYWWRDTTHILTYQSKKARIRLPWDLAQLERKLQISIVTAHTANEANAPRKPLYQRIFRTGPQTRVEPMFVSGIPTPIELHGLVGMDQFRQRRLAPPLCMEAEHIQYYMKWSPLTIPDIQFTAQMMRYTLSNASHTPPYQDLLEYKFLCFLSDTPLERLAQIYDRWYHGEYLHTVFQGDFYALPNKIPHGPIANARPLLNFTTIWKAFSACLKQFFTPILCAAHVISPSQFALHGGASALDMLRVIHDHILDRWFADLLVCMVFDDVRHAFGSVQQNTVEAILRLFHFPPHLISILVNAATGATLHMGGKNGITEALAKFRAGIA